MSDSVSPYINPAIRSRGLSALLTRIAAKVEERSRSPWYDMHRVHFYKDKTGIRNQTRQQLHNNKQHATYTRNTHTHRHVLPPRSSEQPSSNCTCFGSNGL